MNNDAKVKVRLWQGEDLASLKRFWYDIYVTEMGRHRDTADHRSGELDDERAKAGLIIVAERGEDIVGTLICTPAWTDALGEYETLYDMARLGSIHPTSTAIITKLMVAPEYRHSMLSIRISCELYRHAVPLGVYHPIIDCNEHLVPLFTRIGFKAWGPSVNHPVYGQVHVMKLDCLDLDYLEAVQSPLLSMARSIAPQVMQKLSSSSVKELSHECF